FAEAREKQDAGGEGGGGGGVLASNSDRDGGADDVGPDGLHTSWDWGVKLVPAITPPPPRADVAPEVAEDLPVAVDIPRLVRLAAAHIDAPTTNPTALTASLCGTDALQSLSTTISRDEVFSSALVDQSAWNKDPIGVLTNPNLVFRVGDNDTFVQGEALVLSLISNLTFGQPLSESVQTPIDSAVPTATSDSTNAVVPEAPGADSMTPAGSDSQANSASTTTTTMLSTTTPEPQARRWWRWGQRSVSTQQATTQVSAISAVATNRSTTTTKSTTTKTEYDSSAELALDLMSSGDEDPVTGYMSDDGKIAHPIARSQPQQQQRRHVRYAKTLRLSSAQLKSLNLRRGANDVKFLVPSNKAYCEARIYLYRYDTQIVISDIDGTITKSDALGHLFNMVGKDWTHPGVAKLYTDIANNGYEILYLTSRAIGQADGTRYFIGNVKQSAYKLPSGPLLLSPDRLFTSFHREVIMKRPHEFKMACLRDIKNLFGDHSPFYAGFGNRITDAMSYRSVNVPVSRICTIDTYGEIKLDLLPGYKSSYVKINDLVDMMFPALS
ncbi:lipin Ned1, partial [Coemansia aciculifera]